MKYWALTIAFVLIGCSLYQSDDRKILENDLKDLVSNEALNKLFPTCGTNDIAPEIFNELDPIVDSINSEVEIFYDKITQRYYFLGAKNNTYIYCQSKKTKENHILKTSLLSIFKQHLQEQQL